MARTHRAAAPAVGPNDLTQGRGGSSKKPELWAQSQIVRPAGAVHSSLPFTGEGTDTTSLHPTGPAQGTCPRRQRPEGRSEHPGHLHASALPIAPIAASRPATMPNRALLLAASSALGALTALTAGPRIVRGLTRARASPKMRALPVKGERVAADAHGGASSGLSAGSTALGAWGTNRCRRWERSGERLPLPPPVAAWRPRYAAEDPQTGDLCCKIPVATARPAVVPDPRCAAIRHALCRTVLCCAVQVPLRPGSRWTRPSTPRWVAVGVHWVGGWERSPVQALEHH